MIGHYLMFNRNCAVALAAYEEAFSTKAVLVQHYRDMPPNPAFPVADADRDLILHACLEIEGVEIMCADSTMARTSGDSMYVTVTSKDETVITHAWQVLSAGGDVLMPLESSFFAKLHGHVKDAFGINWMFTLE